MKDAPEELNSIVDKVLAYKPKPKSKVAKRRSKRAKLKERKQGNSA